MHSSPARDVMCVFRGISTQSIAVVAFTRLGADEEVRAHEVRTSPLAYAVGEAADLRGGLQCDGVVPHAGGN
jgi:hypothetical protein